MLTVIFFAVLGVGLGFRFSGRHYVGDSIMGLLLGLVLGLGCGIAIGDFASHEEEYNAGVIRLISVRSADGASGAFVFGTGTIGNTGNLVYYHRNSDGSFSMGSVVGDDTVRIVEDPTLKNEAFLTTIRSHLVAAPVIYWFGFVDTKKSDHVVGQTFRVPVGTIAQSYSIK